MKKFLVLAILASVGASPARAWWRSGNSADPSFRDTGDTAVPFAVTIGTTTPVKIYTAATADRELTIQNPNTSYDLYVGTHSAVSASGLPRFLVPKGTSLTINCRMDYWGIMASGLGGSTQDIVGLVERDSKD